MNEPKSALTWKPLSLSNWPDFELLFGKNGGCAGCWCMWWRLTRSQFDKNAYEPNRLAMRAIVAGGQVPGLVFYADGEPAAWISVGRREDFPSLQRSRVLAPVDDQPVSSIVCYFVPRQHRRQGWLLPMTLAACDYARSYGAKIIEAYPMVQEGRVAASSAYMGVAGVLEQAGFKEVLRRSAHHPIMRKMLA